LSALGKLGAALFLAAVAAYAVDHREGADAETGGGGASTTSCASAPSLNGYKRDQMANATIIVSTGKKLDVPERGWVVAIAAALQESGLVNVNHGDRDSLGLFQERPSQGWGTPAQVMNPEYAATQFYRHLIKVRGWQGMSVNDAAQAVEKSGYPNAYAKHEPAARRIVAAVAGTACT
jgi:hypothetical protein